MLQCNKNQGGGSSRWRSALAGAMPVFLAAALLAGCDSVPNAVNPFSWFGDDKSSNDTANAKGKDAGKKDSQGYPTLGSVPDRPAAPSLEAEQKQIREGLVADEKHAHYTDNEVKQEAARREGSTAALGPRVGALPPVPQPSQPSVPPAPSIPAAPTATQQAVAAPSVPPAPSATASVPQASAVASSIPAPPPPLPADPPVSTTVPPQPSVAPPPVPAAPSPSMPAAAPPASAAPILTPPTLTPPPAPAAPVLTEPVKVGTIYFGENSKALGSRDLSILRQIAAAQRTTGKRLRVYGYASGRAQTFDPARRNKINYQVSLRRATAVADALVRYGVPSSMIDIQGLGDNAPRYAETTRAGEAANRRAEIWMLN